MARPDMSWQDSALCAQTDPEAFFPTKGGSLRAIRKLCAACEVRTECLDDALAHDEQHGVRAGLTDRERRKLRRQQQNEQHAA